MTTSEIIEWCAVLLNLIYILLLIREKIGCWAFGIAGSLLSIFLFVEAKLYSEAILYSFYVVIGIYAWVVWARGSSANATFHIKEWTWKRHLPLFILSTVIAFGLGKYFEEHTDAANPMADAGSTIFSFLASFLEAHKILSAWIYWIIINFFSVWLYYSRNLQVYAVLMVLYGLISIYGFIQWRKQLV